MTVTKGSALLLSLICAGAFARASGFAPASPEPSPERLTAISSRVGGKGASLVIEASAPVPYVATRPDPLTVFEAQNRVCRQQVMCGHVRAGEENFLALAVHKTDRRTQIFTCARSILGVEYQDVGQPGQLVSLAIDRQTFLHILEHHFSGHFGNDGMSVRIPLRNHLTGIDMLVFAHRDHRSVGQLVALALATL